MTYFWPPRPDNAVHPSMLGFYRARGWKCQIKKNGTCTVMVVEADHTLDPWTRHNDRHKLWSPSERISVGFSHLKGKNVFAAELLHSKVTDGPRDTLYIFDAMMVADRSLVGMVQQDRMSLIRSLFPNTGEAYSHTIASPGIWIAKDLDDPFEVVMSRLGIEDEGIVLKDPKSKLEECLKPTSNSKWQVKCRIPTKNYHF